MLEEGINERNKYNDLNKKACASVSFLLFFRFGLLVVLIIAREMT